MKQNWNFINNQSHYKSLQKNLKNLNYQSLLKKNINNENLIFKKKIKNIKHINGNFHQEF